MTVDEIKKLTEDVKNITNEITNNNKIIIDLIDKSDINKIYYR